MIIEHRFMGTRWSLYVAVVWLVAGCTKPNPKSCQDGTCTDPGLPFCDVDGALAGEPQTCIAVDCTPGELASCRGDRAITCNTAGTDYELIQCERGCDEAALGCRLCDPNETVCENGKTQACDANGTVVASEPCALGCFEDQPRCRDIDPSNSLAAYLDMVAAPPDLDLENATIFTDSGVISTGALVPSFLVPAVAGGAPLRVFVVGRAHLKNVSVDTAEGFPRVSGPAFVVLARREILVEGRLTLPGVAGGLATLGCVGGQAFEDTRSATNGAPQYLASASGGGGHATNGARGGGIANMFSGGIGGAATGNESLVPLRGGCPSGGFDYDAGQYYAFGVGGGGAVQLASRLSITVNGIVDARGDGGYPEQGQTQIGSVVFGGGAGGGILIEAPQVRLGPDARLLAKGGAGGAKSAVMSTSSDDDAPSPGSTCASASAYCGDGGNGAVPGVGATDGGDAGYTNSPSVSHFNAGGGGGGLGRIRINTPDRTYSRANTTLEVGALSTGTLATR